MTEPDNVITAFATPCMNFMNASLGLVVGSLRMSSETDRIIAEDPLGGQTIANALETSVNIIVLSVELANQLDNFLQLRREGNKPQGLPDRESLIQCISKSFTELKEDFVILKREYTKMMMVQCLLGVKYPWYFERYILPCFAKMINCPVGNTGTAVENVINLLETRWNIFSCTLDAEHVQTSAINDFVSGIRTHILSVCLEAKIVGRNGERVTSQIMDRPFVAELLGSRITLEVEKCLGVLNHYPAIAPYWEMETVKELMDCEVFKILAHLEKSNHNELFEQVPATKICSLYKDIFNLLLRLFTSQVTAEDRSSKLEFVAKTTLMLDPHKTLEPIMRCFEEIRRLHEHLDQDVRTLIECLSTDLGEHQCLRACRVEDTYTLSAKNSFDCVQCVMNTLCRHARDVLSDHILAIKQWRWAVCEPDQFWPAEQPDLAAYDTLRPSVRSLFESLSRLYTTTFPGRTLNLGIFLEKATRIRAASSGDSSYRTTSDFPTSNNPDYLGLSLTDLLSLAEETAAKGDRWITRFVGASGGASAHFHRRPSTSRSQLRFNANSSASRRQWENEKSMSGRPSPSSSQNNVRPSTNGKKDTAAPMSEGRGNSKSFQGDWSF